MKIRNPYHRGLAGRSQSWLGACSLVVCFLAAGHSMAQSTWTGDTDALWSTDLNWSGTPPNSYSSGSLIFNPANLTGSANFFNNSHTTINFKMLPLSERDGANLYLEHRADLGISDQWSSVLVPDATGGTAPVTFAVSGTAPLDVEATISPSEALGGTLFGRLKTER